MKESPVAGPLAHTPNPSPLEPSNCLGLPLFLLFSFSPLFPSITVFSSESPLSICPIHFLCLFLILYIRVLSSSILASSSSICSVQLMFSILPHIHIAC